MYEIDKNIVLNRYFSSAGCDVRSCLVIVLLLVHGVVAARYAIGLFGCKHGQGGVCDARMLMLTF
jgi:hypothetical protein